MTLTPEQIDSIRVKMMGLIERVLAEEGIGHTSINISIHEVDAELPADAIPAVSCTVYESGGDIIYPSRGLSLFSKRKEAEA